MSLLAQLFATHTNTLTVTASGFDTGHDPVHSSKSGRCVTIDTTKALWYCRACEMGGGLVEALMSLDGLSRVDAEAKAAAMGGAKTPRAGGNQESLLANQLAAQYQDALAYDGAAGQWLAYGTHTPGIWQAVDAAAPEDSALARLKQDLDTARPEGYSWSFCRGVERLLRLALLTRFPACPATHLPVRNGLLDLHTLQLQSYTPAHRLTWCVPFPWDPTASCPRTLAWLQEATRHDAGVIAVLRAYLKAILLGRTDLHRFVELIGPGGSGKGTCVRLATGLIGVRNTYATELRRLESSRFETANLRGKRLIVVTDAERFAGEVDVLKALTGGDSLPFEEKYKQGRNGMAEGLVLLAANEAIMSSDYTSGLARRRITIPFLHQPTTRTNLLALVGDHVEGELAPELPGVLRWVLALPTDRMEALLRSTTVEVRSLARAQAENLIRINPLAQWADEHLVHDTTPEADGKWPKTYVGTARRYTPKESPATYENLDIWLYANYRDFTEAVNNKPISMRRFSDTLADLCVHQLHLAGVAHSRDKGGAYFSGLRVRAETDTASPRLITPEALAGDGLDRAGDGWVTDQIHADAGSDGCDGCKQVSIGEEMPSSRACESSRARERGECCATQKLFLPITPVTSVTDQQNQTLNPSSIHHHPSPNPSPDLSPEAGAGAPTVTVGATLDLPALEYVTTAARLNAVVAELRSQPQLGLDTETTGLDWQTARLRLVQLATPTQVVLVDAFQCPLLLLQPLLESATTFVGHNLKFDLHMLTAAGLPCPPHLLDTMLLAQLLGASAAKGPKVSYRLQDVVQRTLGTVLDKTLQTSAWEGPLAPAQLQYAARDAAVLGPLADALTTAVHAASLTEVAALEHACLPALVWMEHTGVPVDPDRWLALAQQYTLTTAKVEAELHAALALARNGHGALFPEPVNWKSPPQVLQVLADRGHQVANTAAETLAPLAALDPLVAQLLAYREAGVRARTFGKAWLTKHQHAVSGRVHADYFQLGSTAGRMSCSRPNMQNIPRSSAYRACFRPAPGQCLVKADYSQIELRLAALLAEDATMLAAFHAGEDVHRLTAARLLTIAPSTVTPDHRQLAKAVNFGLLYGMGAPRLREYAQTQYRVTLSQEEAHAHRQAFFALYPGIRQWHRATGAQLDHAGTLDTRTMVGRRRLAVARYTEALNTPVQGTGADGLKAALARLWTHRHEAPEARLIACIHDEVVVECPVEQAEATAAWLRTHMTTAMAEVVHGGVPIAVETTIGEDWAGTPLGGPATDQSKERA